MAADAKITSDHVENAPQHEAILTGVIALANLFSSCVEAFGLIHPSQRWAKDEQLLMTRLGLQQARLLIFGDVCGITSPPNSVTDRAVPKHPSSAYPDLSEPTFFAPRDPRLDEPEARTTIEAALSAIVDRSSTHTREEMMAKFGLKPPKKPVFRFEPALDLTRLEAFRERWELLREVAESYAQISTRRNNSIIHSSWMIADTRKFADFIDLTQNKVDSLIGLMDVKERVDRAMSMDIRALGWHLTADRGRVAQDVSKLRLLNEICKHDYPEYLEAIRKAMDNISREAREYAGLSPYPDPLNDDGVNGKRDTAKKPGLFDRFRSLGKPRHSRIGSLSDASSDSFDAERIRSMSDSGLPGAEPAALDRIRSKSIGAYIDTPSTSIDEELLRLQMQRMKTQEPLPEEPPAQELPTMEPPPLRVLNTEPIRHDQYKGLGRVNTKDLHQADF